MPYGVNEYLKDLDQAPESTTLLISYTAEMFTLTLGNWALGIDYPGAISQFKGEGSNSLAW
jgi:hypothetical protein